jgi:hypothetical protein
LDRFVGQAARLFALNRTGRYALEDRPEPRSQRFIVSTNGQWIDYLMFGHGTAP